MDDKLFGMKELYDVTLRANTEVLINGKWYKPNEVIVRFGRIQISQLNGTYSHAAAKGGYDNRELVTWDETKSVLFNFASGVFSKEQFSFFINSRLFGNAPLEKKLIPISQTLEADENGECTLKRVPQELFVYDSNSGETVEYELEEKTISGLAPFQSILCDYYAQYEENAQLFQTGTAITNSYLKLEGKTRLKDDTTGHIVTGIVTIPRLKLKSGLSIKLGENAEPIVGVFQGEGYPVGTKGSKTVSSLLMLSDDIDSDF